jgi:hypothetical protein
MKSILKLSILPFLIILMIISCSKNPVEPNIVIPKDITGKWKWIFTYTEDPECDTCRLTPQNTGIQEILVFNTNHTWFKTQNNIKTDSGTFSLGHGSHTPYTGAWTFVYDSICYYKNGIHYNGEQDYYNIFHDTLEFSPGYAGRFISYTLPYNGGKFWIKQ